MRSTPPRSATSILLLISSSLAACDRASNAPPPPPPPTVDVASPLVREITEWDEYTGRLAAVETVEVRPRVSGYLESVHFRDGQIVTKGDLLFVIDSRPFRATLAAAEAEVTGAQTRLELARNDAERAEPLVSTKAISVEEYDAKSKAALEAQAALEAAQAVVEQARLNVEFTEVRSPIDGRISNAFVTTGNLITGGAGGGDSTLLTTIVSLDPIYCYFTASEQDYLKYTRLAASGARPSSRDKANPVRIALADEADYSHEGKMDFVDNQLDELTGTIRGRAIFDNHNHQLIPGLFVRLQLIGETNPGAVLVPDLAIGTDQSNRIVYVLDKDNVPRIRIVTPGRLIDGMRVVKSGLDGSETIVINGVQRVRPGSPVKPERKELTFTPTTQPTVPTPRITTTAPALNPANATGPAATQGQGSGSTTKGGL